MKKPVIGYIFSGPSLGADEHIFIKLAKKNNTKLVLLDISKGIEINKILEKIKDCDIFYNNTAEEFSIEIEKSIEELGKKVIDTSESFYYSEDKWLFYLKCKENNIPIPETILLSEKINIAKRELKEFDYWPVILKRIEGTTGDYVDKADNLKEAEKIIKKFWKKGSQRLPIIAQELIISPSYRITVIGGSIVQTAAKTNSGWKATGVYAKRIKRFKIDKKLKKIIEKIYKISGIKVLGIDFLKKNGEWVALEINSAPAFDFFECEREKIIKKVLKLLIKEAKIK